MSSSDRENERVVEDGEPDVGLVEEEEEEEDVVRRNGTRRNRDETGDGDDDGDRDDQLPDDEDEDDDIFGGGGDDDEANENDNNNNEEDGAYQKEEEEVTLRIEQTTIPRYPRSHRPAGDLYYVPTPAFMTMEPHPFEASKFQEELSEEQANDGGFKVRNENTVRWKYAKDSKGNVTKQSNSRIVKWSDGSMSLQLGQELFDIVIQEPYDQTFLCLSHPANSLLQTAGIFTKNMRIVPTSTSSRSHKRLAQELNVRQLSTSVAVSSVATTDDPEKVQREAEKAAEMTLRARRKLESKQRLQQERSAGIGGATSAGSASSRYSYDGERDELAGGYDARASARAGDEYEEDDFVVDDEDEEEDGEPQEGDDDEGADDLDDLEEEEDDDEAERQRAKRLHDLKERGAELYSRRSEERDSQQTRKKRRIFDDEDDDE
ncbi:Leo1p [Sugiyamaella lignohabitans]|uniref:Leo1p n=1 Tax=Sugiyamaella lignohabitans TaxID=796027 RepID=A0A167F979_9ASCO|nr:Leo1p [Sugiyamaella lignohabitans]ANB14985.1 Leo1p [Sugiyamaella lignohabitans]